jgi:hypothetical protein
LTSETEREWSRASHDLRREFLAQKPIFRVFLVLILLVSTVGGLAGGFVLAHEVHHWAAWVIALFFLEPVGIASLLSLVSFAAPESFAAYLLGGALRRASRAAFVGLVLYALIVVAAVVYAMFLAVHAAS